MIRRLLPAVGVLAAAAVLSSGLSSCSSVDRSNIAAEVNGNRLTNEQLATLAEDSTDAVVVRDTLTGWIQVATMSDEAESMTSKDALDKGRTDILKTLIADLGDPGREEYEKGLAGTFVCMRAIPLDAAVKSADVLAAIDGGMTFADAAKQYSAVESLAATGGIVADQTGNGCFDQTTLDTAFPQLRQALTDVDAQLGVPTVIADPGGEIVILLRPYDDLAAADLVTVGQVELSAAIAKAYKDADIWVNSRIGAWDAKNGSVVALTEAGS